jgi:hypothetical protein
MRTTRGGRVVRADTLREQLLSLTGVAGVDVESSGGTTMAGVRVRLAPGADARTVGVEVQRVLASHGLRSRVGAGEVVAPPVDERPEHDADTDASAEDTSAALRAEEPRPSGVGAEEVPVAAVGLRSVSVEEGPDGAAVTVTAVDGRRVTEPAEPTEEGTARAVVAAVARLLGGGGARLTWMTRSDEAGASVVTVVVELSDGSRRAGAAIVRAGPHHAAARAAFAALR